MTDRIDIHPSAVLVDADPTSCYDCGGPLTFDPAWEGETVGGVKLAGALRCLGAEGNTEGCGMSWLSRRAVTSESWKLAKGGRSVDAGGTRIRCEAGADAERLMARVARLPELERALRVIAAGAADAAAVARAALESS
jgi:hypothetical protein